MGRLNYSSAPPFLPLCCSGGGEEMARHKNLRKKGGLPPVPLSGLRPRAYLVRLVLLSVRVSSVSAYGQPNYRQLAKKLGGMA